MADSNLAQSQSNVRTVQFATVTNLYALHPEATERDVRDHLSARLDQLSAMLEVICGRGSEGFGKWSDDVQDDYLWACSMVANECKALANHLVD